MIGFIRGTVAEVSGNRAIIDNNGIGYEVLITSGAAGQLSFADGEVTLYTVLSLKDEVLSLFGFLEKDELALFKLLITVSGIGPKGALSILSSMSVSDICFAIVSEDAKQLATAPGIGKKTAEKAIIELKDKLENISTDHALSLNRTADGADGSVKGGRAESIRKDAVAALTALGFSPSEAAKAVAPVDIKEDTNIEDVIRLALKR